MDYSRTDTACIHNRIIPTTSRELSDARLTGLSIQAQLIALEDSITEGHGVPTDLMAAWLCTMRQQLKQIDTAIVASLCDGGRV